MSSPEQDLIRAEVLLKDATVFVIFTGRENRWPFRVENRTNVDVEMWQQVRLVVTERDSELIPASRDQNYAIGLQKKYPSRMHGIIPRPQRRS